MYNALIDLLKTEDRYFTKKEICEALPNFFSYNFNENAHDECSNLWNAKDYINNRIEEFNIIIISNRQGDLKIPTQEELKDSLDEEFRRCCKRFDRYWKKAKAFNLINQNTLIGEDWEIVRKD